MPKFLIRDMEIVKVISIERDHTQYLQLFPVEVIRSSLNFNKALLGSAGVSQGSVTRNEWFLFLKELLVIVILVVLSLSS